MNRNNPAKEAERAVATAPTPGERLVAVDILRGVAALLVIAYHIPRPVPTGFNLQMAAILPFDLGSLGVPMFIVISGFCIHLGYARRLVSGRASGWNWGAFWKRRFVRLYPTYVAAAVFSVGVAYAIAAWSAKPAVLPTDRLGDTVTHVLMVHNLTENFNDGMGNPPFWSLGLEEQLYALFAVVVLLRTRVSATRILRIGLAVSVAWRVARVWVQFLLSRYTGAPDEPPVLPLGPVVLGYWQGWPFGWWFLWLLGAVAAEAHVGLIRVPRWCASWGMVLIAGAITLLTHWRTLGRYARNWLSNDGAEGWVRAGLNTVVGLSELAFAVGCFALLLRLIRCEQSGGLTSRPARATAAIGLISYSLYLTHYPLLDIFGQAFGTVGGVGEAVLRFALYTPLCVAFAVAFFFAFERPFLRRKPAGRRE